MKRHARKSPRHGPYRLPREWSAEEVRALRQHLGLTQDEFSDHIGTRQQTVSEWEVGKHRPRGASRVLLTVIAESAGFAYSAGAAATAAEDTPGESR
ncbi:MAG TPA: helix-turn-helix domain-containing protein [Ktedonobacterales bacterium]|nr:helix-turn-helix domain-containing protein [Ktedonobacterales bacterium]